MPTWSPVALNRATIAGICRRFLTDGDIFRHNVAVSDISGERQAGLFSAPFDRQVPYNHLPLLPPAVETESKRTLKVAIAARAALAELEGLCSSIPNPLLVLDGLILQEARRSSEIENIVTTNDELYAALDAFGPAIDPGAKEVIHYKEALWHGYEALRGGRPISTSLLVELVGIIRRVEIGIRKARGTRVVSDHTNEVVYTPPEGAELLLSLLDNLTEFLHREDGLDPVIKMAVAHYQFEAIHPFDDGNGRVGRILNVLYLVERQLLTRPVLFLSRYINHTRDQYYEGLRRVTEEAAWEDWICYVLQGVAETAADTLERIKMIRDELDKASRLASEHISPQLRHDIVTLLFERPYLRIQTVVQRGIAQRQAAARALDRLERAGLLRSARKGRERVYVNQPLMAILSR